MKTSTMKLLSVAMIGLGATTAMAVGAEGRERPSFETMDVDGSGEITAEDLAAMQANRFAELDSDGNGSISETEFVAHAESQAAERAAERFARLDADGDGVLSQDAIQGQRRGGNPERMIARLDTDDSGGVSAEEFEAGMERFTKRRLGGKHRRGDSSGRN